MSCLALPVAGRPTRRARRSSAAVDSGMSERSSLLSGVGLAFLARRLACADDANEFLAMFQPPLRVNYDENSARERRTEALGALLRVRVLGIFPIECIGVDENRCGFFKRDTVFLEVVEGLVGVPREHICVYTLIGRDCKWGEEQMHRRQIFGG
jgi:hypothetical protein